MTKAERYYLQLTILIACKIFLQIAKINEWSALSVDMPVNM